MPEIIEEARRKAADYRECWKPMPGDCPTSVLLDNLCNEIERLREAIVRHERLQMAYAGYLAVNEPKDHSCPK